MQDRDMTLEELVHCENYPLIDVCDGCGEYTPITNDHDGKNFLTFINDKLYCQKCLK